MAGRYRPPAPRQGYLPAGNARLFFREIGQGRPVVVLHGGPDFDHNYLLPEMDRLARSLRLIYYDQRGRGKSAEDVQPEQVSIDSEIEDLESVRSYFSLDSMAILGHSWGGLLAMEYATRYPERVSHLILMNPAPASHEDLLFFRQERLRKTPGDLEQMKAIASTPEYQQGEIETEAEYYRIHFRSALRLPEHVEQVVKRLRVGMTPAGIRKARLIESRLYERTWLLSDYNLLPRLGLLSIPALVIHGRYDFVPLACNTHIAQAIPGARLVLLEGSGHFSSLDNPEGVSEIITRFFEEARPPGGA